MVALVRIQGALNNPHPQNNQKGIRFTDCPEWGEGVAGIKVQGLQ